MKQRKDGRWVRKIILDGKTKYFYSSEPTQRKAQKDIEEQIFKYKNNSGGNATFFMLPKVGTENIGKKFRFTTTTKQ